MKPADSCLRFGHWSEEDHYYIGEPSAGAGAFLSAMFRRLAKSCRRHETPLAEVGAKMKPGSAAARIELHRI